MPAAISFAQLYDAQYHDFDADIQLWLDHARQSGSPVLELGCGSGRVLLPLMRAGCRMAGVDHDPQMLELARTRLVSQEMDGFDLLCADLTSFNLNERFKLALSPLNTLATLADDAFLATIACTARHLEPGASLICDLPNPSTALEERSDPDEILDEFIDPRSGCAVQVRATVERLDDGFVQRVEWVYEVLSDDGLAERFRFEQLFHLRGIARLRQLAAPSGMELRNAFGDYDASPYSDDTPRLIAVFRRAG